MIFFDLDDTLIDRKRAEYLGVKGFYSEQSTLFGATEEAFYESWRTISHRHFLRFLRGEISFAQQRIERMKDVFALSGIELSDSEAGEQFRAIRGSSKQSWASSESPGQPQTVPEITRHFPAASVRPAHLQLLRPELETAVIQGG